MAVVITTAFVSIQKCTALSAINFVKDGREDDYLKRFFHCLVFLVFGTNLVIFYEVVKRCWMSGGLYNDLKSTLRFS